METNRQEKIATLIQKDIAEILQSDARNGMRGLLISVSKVRITPDLSMATVFISIFPTKNKDIILKGISENVGTIKYQLAKRVKNQLRKLPHLVFKIDDSLDYIEKIDQALKGNEENPIFMKEGKRTR